MLPSLRAMNPSKLVAMKTEHRDALRQLVAWRETMVSIRVYRLRSPPTIYRPGRHR